MRLILGSERLIGSRATGGLLVVLIVVLVLAALVVLAVTHALTPATPRA